MLPGKDAIDDLFLNAPEMIEAKGVAKNILNATHGPSLEGRDRRSNPVRRLFSGLGSFFQNALGLLPVPEVGVQAAALQ